MPQSKQPEVHQSNLLPIILPTLNSDWFSIALGGLKFAKKLLSRQMQEGIYEILDYDTVLELKDAQGQVAVFTRRQKVKFLQDNVIAYQDFAWGDGDILSSYQCTPGVPVDKYQNGFRHNILISLRETKNSGDVLEFNIQRTVTGGFTKPNEWWQVLLEHRTRRLKMTAIFPKARPCRRATMTKRNIKQTLVLGDDYFNLLPDGRQVLSWETPKPRLFELYTLKWHW